MIVDRSVYAESDFVRLEKDSSSGNTESEGEEPLSGARVSTMTTSGSSVGSEFRFFTGTGGQYMIAVNMQYFDNILCKNEHAYTV